MALRPALAVEGDGEPVRLVAQPLQQVEAPLVRGRMTGWSSPGNHTSSRRLARPHEGHLLDAELVERRRAAATCGSPPSTTTRLGG